MRVMFLDESGTHNLGKRAMKGNYTLFVLGGVIIDRAYLRATVEPQMNQFKQQYFGRTDVILHTVDMRNGIGDYAFLADPVLRTGFYADLNALLDAWDYKVIGCVIDKPRYVARYAYPADPYHYSLDILVERFCSDLGAQLDAGFICAEKRGDDLDRALLEAWGKPSNARHAVLWTQADRRSDRWTGSARQEAQPGGPATRGPRGYPDRSGPPEPAGAAVRSEVVDCAGQAAPDGWIACGGGPGRQAVGSSNEERPGLLRSTQASPGLLRSTRVTRLYYGRRVLSMTLTLTMCFCSAHRRDRSLY